MNRLYIFVLFSLVLSTSTVSANEPWVAKPESLATDFAKSDQKGALRYLTQQKVQESLKLIDKGEVISLGVPLNRKTPAYGWRSFQLIVAQNEGTAHSNNEDVIFAPINTGTQIDGLAHMGINGHFYGGRKGSDIQTVSGLKELGIENVSPIITRGVLLDIAGLKGVERLDIGYAISIEDAELAMERQGISDIRPGDVVLFHTGHRTLLNTLDQGLFLKGQPGPGVELAKWLVSKGVVAVGGDSGSMEVMPFESKNLLFPVHQILLAQSGVYILENVATERLAERGWYEFMFMISPLPITGSSSSWINPVAIK